MAYPVLLALLTLVVIVSNVADYPSEFGFPIGPVVFFGVFFCLFAGFAATTIRKALRSDSAGVSGGGPSRGPRPESNDPSARICAIVAVVLFPLGIILPMILNAFHSSQIWGYLFLGMTFLSMLFGFIGHRYRMGRFTALAALLILVAALAVALIKLPMGSGGGVGPNPLGSGGSAVNSSSGPAGAVHPGSQPGLWERVSPDEPPNLRLHLIVPKGHAATLELIGTDASGEQRVVGQEWVAVASDLGALEGFFAIGAPRWHE